MTREHFAPLTVHKPIGAYSPAVRVGNVIFVSGQIPLQPDGRVVSPADPRGQAVQCFENLRNVLDAAGASLRDVVKITTFSTHHAHRQVMGEVRREFLEPPYPASTSVIVTSLAEPEYLFEIEAVAILE